MTAYTFRTFLTRPPFTHSPFPIRPIFSYTYNMAEEEEEDNMACHASLDFPLPLTSDVISEVDRFLRTSINF